MSPKGSRAARRPERNSDRTDRGSGTIQIGQGTSRDRPPDMGAGSARRMASLRSPNRECSRPPTRVGMRFAPKPGPRRRRAESGAIPMQLHGVAPRSSPGVRTRAWDWADRDRPRIRRPAPRFAPAVVIGFVGKALVRRGHRRTHPPSPLRWRLYAGTQVKAIVGAEADLYAATSRTLKPESNPWRAARCDDIEAVCSSGDVRDLDVAEELLLCNTSEQACRRSPPA